MAVQRAGAAVEPVEVLRPQAGPQEAFLSSAADIVVYGGAAGSGKSFGLLMEPLRYVHVPGFTGVIFRRTAVQVRNEGGLWDESMRVYGGLRPGPTPRPDRLFWTWPKTKARIRFAHLEHDADKLAWSGSQVPYIGFDELQLFLEGQFWFMLSRNRSVCGVKPYVRATCNPVPKDDLVGGWLNRLLDWWIDPDSGLPIPERSGVLRWFVRVEDELVWADSEAELRAKFPLVPPKSLTFIAAKLTDNPILMELDPGYLANLMALQRVERLRLLEGRWHVSAGAGEIFNRAWFPIVKALPAPALLGEGEDAVPETVAAVRYWDKAGTMGGDADRTAGVRMVRVGQRFFITDVTKFRFSALERERVLKNLALQDGTDTTIWVEQEPGSGGVESADATVRMLAGFRVFKDRPTGAKVTRWGPFAAQVEAGNVYLVEGAWNEDFLREIHNADGREGHLDDQVDAAAGAFNKLVGSRAGGIY